MRFAERPDFAPGSAELLVAVRRFAHEVVPQLASGRMRAIIDRDFPVEEAAGAFDHMAGTGKFGEVLLAF